MKRILWMLAAVAALTVFSGTAMAHGPYPGDRHGGYHHRPHYSYGASYSYYPRPYSGYYRAPYVVGPPVYPYPYPYAYPAYGTSFGYSSPGFSLFIGH